MRETALNFFSVYTKLDTHPNLQASLTLVVTLLSRDDCLMFICFPLDGTLILPDLKLDCILHDQALGSKL